MISKKILKRIEEDFGPIADCHRRGHPYEEKEICYNEREVHLRCLNCGFFYSRPLTEEEKKAFLDNLNKRFTI